MLQKPWTQPPLPGVTITGLVVIRLEVVISQDDGRTYWALTATQAGTGAPLGGMVTPHVQRETRHDVQNDYIREWRMWVDDYMPPF